MARYVSALYVLTACLLVHLCISQNTIAPHKDEALQDIFADLYEVQKDDPNAVIADEYIVVLKEDVSNDALKPSGPQSVAAFLSSEYNAEILDIFEFESFGALHIQATEEQMESLNLNQANEQQLKAIHRVYPNMKVSANNVIPRSNTTCNTHHTHSSRWGLSRIAMKNLEPYNQASYTWTSKDNGANVDVYVFDTGVKVEHLEFGGRARHGFTAPGLGEGDDDLRGHGTHVAGVIGSGSFGVAKGVNLIAVKVLNQWGGGSFATIISGIMWALKEHNMQRRTVWNFSLGGVSTFDFNGLFRIAYRRGITSVAASGNSNSNACWSTPSFIPEVLSIASSNKLDQFSSFSNYGRCVDLVAPGENILSTFISGNGTSVKSGTSFSSAFVSGAAARLLSGSSVTGPEEVKKRLQQTSTSGRLTDMRPGTVNQLLHTPTCSMNE